MPKNTPGLLSAGTVVLLDVPCNDLNDAFDVLQSELWADGEVDDEHLQEIAHQLHQHADLGPDVLTHGVGVVHAQLRTHGEPVQALLRLPETVALEDAQGDAVRFLWVLMSGQHTHPAMARAAEFAKLCADRSFRAAALTADSPEALDAVYGQALDDDIHFHPNVPPALRPSGEWFGALRADIKRKQPTWISDFTDGLNAKALASTIFLYFACLAPSVAFGGLLSVMTDGAIGVVETMLATAITGVIYAFASGQPLSILGSTGPITAFLGVLYGACAYFDVPYLPTLAWVGLWTSLYLFVLIAVDGVSLIRFFTRFTDDTFAGLIALIYLWEAISDIGGVFTDHEVSHETALSR